MVVDGLGLQGEEGKNNIIIVLDKHLECLSHLRTSKVEMSLERKSGAI